jgi:hypothetical protein
MNAPSSRDATLLDKTRPPDSPDLPEPDPDKPLKFLKTPMWHRREAFHLRKKGDPESMYWAAHHEYLADRIQKHVNVARMKKGFAPR